MRLLALELQAIDEAGEVAIGLVDDRSAGLYRRSGHIERGQASAKLGLTLVDGQCGRLFGPCQASSSSLLGSTRPRVLASKSFPSVGTLDDLELDEAARHCDRGIGSRNERHLERFVRIEQEVAVRGAPRQRQGGARVDNAGSSHASSIEANAMPTRGPVISGAWKRCCGGFVSGRRRTSLHETTEQSADACCVWGNLGRLSLFLLRRSVCPC